MISIPQKHLAQPEASCVEAAALQRILPCRPVALVAPRLEVGFCPRRREGAPGRFKAGASVFKRRPVPPLPSPGSVPG